VGRGRRVGICIRFALVGREKGELFSISLTIAIFFVVFLRVACVELDDKDAGQVTLFSSTVATFISASRT
jgi:hypothetical protein